MMLVTVGFSGKCIPVLINIQGTIRKVTVTVSDRECHSGHHDCRKSMAAGVGSLTRFLLVVTQLAVSLLSGRLLV
jgi:hypothetical protein